MEREEEIFRFKQLIFITEGKYICREYGDTRPKYVRLLLAIGWQQLRVSELIGESKLKHRQEGYGGEKFLVLSMTALRRCGCTEPAVELGYQEGFGQRRVAARLDQGTTAQNRTGGRGGSRATQLGARCLGQGEANHKGDTVSVAVH